MKITDIKIYLTEGSWTLVQVFTDGGIVGVGDATNWPGEEAVSIARDERELGYDPLG